MDLKEKKNSGKALKCDFGWSYVNVDLSLVKNHTTLVSDVDDGEFVGVGGHRKNEDSLYLGLPW